MNSEADVKLREFQDVLREARKDAGEIDRLSGMYPRIASATKWGIEKAPIGHKDQRLAEVSGGLQELLEYARQIARDGEGVVKSDAAAALEDWKERRRQTSRDWFVVGWQRRVYEANFLRYLWREIKTAARVLSHAVRLCFYQLRHGSPTETEDANSPSDEIGNAPNPKPHIPPARTIGAEREFDERAETEKQPVKPPRTEQRGADSIDPFRVAEMEEVVEPEPVKKPTPAERQQAARYFTFDRDIQWLRSQANAFPWDNDMDLKMAQLYARKRDHKQAVKKYRDFLKKEPARHDARLEMIDCLIALRELDQALSEAQSLTTYHQVKDRAEEKLAEIQELQRKAEA